MDREDASDSGRPQKPASRGIGWLRISSLVVILIVCAYLNAPRLTTLFGPPAVTMTEAYEPKPGGPVFDHSAFDALLKQHVNGNGGVDYAGLKQDADALRQYNASLADAPFDDMGRDEKLALLINAYNAFTLQLILEHLDAGITSIKDIPADKRWDDARWNIGGHVWSLNQIEHEQIRPKFREPNVHWALVCAAVGCPPLRAEAYTADKLGEQLADQARTIHTDGSRWFGYDAEAKVLHLTPLYDWYGSDFEQVAQSVLDYAARYNKTLRQALDSGRQPRVEWRNYDWSLNSQENLP